MANNQENIFYLLKMYPFLRYSCEVRRYYRVHGQWEKDWDEKNRSHIFFTGAEENL